MGEHDVILRFFKNFLNVSLFVYMAIFVISMANMSIYLGKKRICSTWKLVTGFIAPWEWIGLYVSNTKKEYGRIGIWLKLLVGSFVAAILTAIIMLIL